MNLPPHPDVSVDQIRAATVHHGLPAGPVARLTNTGIFNAIYLLGTGCIVFAAGGRAMERVATVEHGSMGLGLMSVDNGNR